MTPDRKAPVASIGLLFPGQASHEAGMASAWLPVASARFDRLSSVLGIDLPAVADDPAACGSTAVAQPSIFATSIAALDALVAAGVRPSVVAGHSLGEVAAAVAAGSLDVEDAARLVLARGQAMGRACRTSVGGLLAVLGASADEVQAVLSDHPDVTIANDNGATQLVIGGPAAALAAAGDALRTAGAKVLALEVEGAFHTVAMTPAMVTLAQVVARTPVADPRVEFLSATTGRACRDAAGVRRALTEGVLAPVRWTAVQAALAGRDLDVLVEVGPGRVLRGLARREIPDVPCLSLRGPADLELLLDHLRGVDADRASRREEGQRTVSSGADEPRRAPQPIGARP